jgi:membrane peptidoglycan carboxypeptidase
MDFPDGRREGIESPLPVRILKPETAVMMRAMMERTILEGTGRLARTPGYRVAGKTGTAQKIDEETGAYSHQDYVPSFVGFAPINNPAIVAVIVLDSPVGHYYGGQVAAPVFPPLATETLRYLDVAPELPLPSPHDPKPVRTKKVPNELLADYTGAPVAEEAQSPRDQDGSLFVALRPAVHTLARAVPSEANAPSRSVRLRVSDGVVPDFRGQTVRDVVGRAATLGVRLEMQGSGTARWQTPLPGTPLRRGQPVRVVFARLPASVSVQ